MPPAIALLLCTIFVLFMLRLDRKQSPGVSFALWIPTIWMLVISSKPLGIWFNSKGATMEDGSDLDRTFLIILLCLGITILIKRKLNWSNAIKNNIWLMLLIGYMLISILWSDIPYISFKRWSREVVAIIMASVIATESDPQKALESLIRRIIYILIPFSYILIHYFAEYGRIYVHHHGLLMWVGATLHKNQLGQLCILSAFFLIWTIIKRQQERDIATVRYQTYLDVFILFLTFLIMGGPERTFTYSATSTAALIVGLLAFIGLSWKKKSGTMLGPKVLIVLIVFIILYGVVTPMIGKLSIVDLSSVFGRDETLTGRTDIWARLVPAAMTRPILGFGFGGFWTTKAQEIYGIMEPHNGYLQVILDLGFVGILLFTTFLVSSIRKAQKVMTQDFYWGTLWICYLLMLTVSNITDSSLCTFTFRISAVVLLLTISSTTAAHTHTVSL